MGACCWISTVDALNTENFAVSLGGTVMLVYLFEALFLSYIVLLIIVMGLAKHHNPRVMTPFRERMLSFVETSLGFLVGWGWNNVAIASLNRDAIGEDQMSVLSAKLSWLAASTFIAILL